MPVTAMDVLELNPAQLLFLATCHSSEPQFSDALATQLLRGGFPAVLSWAGTLSDAEGKSFGISLYQALGRRQPLEKAVAQARFNLLQENLNSLDWHLARLFLGANGGGVLCRGEQARPSA